MQGWNSWTARSCAALWVALWVASTAMAGAQPKPPPLRIVYETRPLMPLMREVLDARVQQCVASLKLRGGEVALPALPPDSVLGQSPTVVSEVLMDGEFEAVFTRSRLFFPDAANGCRVRWLYKYEAAVARTCQDGWSGVAGVAIAHGFNGVTLSEPTLGARDWRRKGRCKPDWEVAAPSVQAQQAQATRSGQACYWHDELAGLPFSTGARACVHPSYQYPLRKHLTPTLVLKTDYIAAEDGFVQMASTPEWNEGRSEAVLFEQGKAIASERFGKAAVAAFINQPVWVSLGDR